MTSSLSLTNTPLLAGTTTDTSHANTAGNETRCFHYQDLVEMWFIFDTYQLVRVTVTWILFVLSATGNIFVLVSLRHARKTHHFIMFHLALADLMYSCLVLPTDAIWNTTMQWFTGNTLCKIAQMLKQFGMYSSSFMVVVIGVDRVTAILYPVSATHQKRIGVCLVVAAWFGSAVCCIPAGALFSILEVPTCEGITITQCVDNLLIDKNRLNSYYFFTMFASFVLPFISTLISYSLIVCEISKMKERDRELMGRRNSQNTQSMQKAINKTILMRTLITMTFLICWGPYYAKGIVDWFIRDISQPETGNLSKFSYLLMYLNCLLHPVVFGIFMKEVRKSFYNCFCCYRNENMRNHFSKSKGSRASVSSLTTNATNMGQTCIYNNRSTSLSTKTIQCKDEAATPLQQTTSADPAATRSGKQEARCEII